MCNPQKISVAELFSAISSWDWAQNEGWTFVLQDHKKKISQFSVVKSVSSIMLDHSENPFAQAFLRVVFPRKIEVQMITMTRRFVLQQCFWHQKIALES